VGLQSILQHRAAGADVHMIGVFVNLWVWGAVGGATAAARACPQLRRHAAVGAGPQGQPQHRGDLQEDGREPPGRAQDAEPAPDPLGEDPLRPPGRPHHQGGPRTDLPQAAPRPRGHAGACVRARRVCVCGGVRGARGRATGEADRAIGHSLEPGDLVGRSCRVVGGTQYTG
jgi:hypothetical protein